MVAEVEQVAGGQPEAVAHPAIALGVAADLLGADPRQRGAFLRRGEMVAMLDHDPVAVGIDLGLGAQRQMGQAVIVVAQHHLGRQRVGLVDEIADRVRHLLQQAADPAVAEAGVAMAGIEGDPGIPEHDDVAPVEMLEEVEDPVLLGEAGDEGEIALLILRDVIVRGVVLAQPELDVGGVEPAGEHRPRSEQPVGRHLGADHVGHGHRRGGPVDLVLARQIQQA